MIPSENFFLSLIWLHKFLTKLVFPIPGGPRTFTSLFDCNNVKTSHISCCLPLKFSTFVGMELKKGIISCLVNVPSLNLVIGKHICLLLFTLLFISQFSFFNIMNLFASPILINVLTSSLAIS